MKHQVCASAICPFYKHETPSTIYCEGVEDMTVIHLAFADRSDCAAYKRRFCRTGYGDCLIMRMLARKEKDNGRLKKQ